MRQELKFSILFAILVMLFTACKTLDRAEHTKNENKQVAQNGTVQSSSKNSDTKKLNTFAKETNEESKPNKRKEITQNRHKM